MPYTNKERGEHLIEYAEKLTKADGVTPLYLGLYRSNLRREGIRLTKLQDSPVEDTSADNRLIDLYTKDPDKFFSVLDGLEDESEN